MLAVPSNLFRNWLFKSYLRNANFIVFIKIFYLKFLKNIHKTLELITLIK